MVISGKSLVTIGLIGLLAACCSKPDEEHQEEDMTITLEQPLSVPNELIVEVEPEFDPAQLSQVLQGLEPQWEWIGSRESNLLLLKFPQPVDQVVVTDQLKAVAGIKQVQPNNLLQPMQE